MYIIILDSTRAWLGVGSPIFVLAGDRLCSWVTICGNNTYGFIILPRRYCQIFHLTGFAFSSLFSLSIPSLEALFISGDRKPFRFDLKVPQSYSPFRSRSRKSLK